MDSLLYRWTRPQLADSGAELLSSVVRSGQWSYGPVAKQVERELCGRLGAESTSLTNSGTSALWLLLAMLRKPTRQTVVIPAFGYSAAASVAASLGYSIYLADCTPEAPVVDPGSIKKLVDDSVAAVIGINYFGYSVEWDDMPKGGDYVVIEDAAGSYGAAYKERSCGTNADCAILSFHTSKAVAAGGQGGCIVAPAEMTNKARAFANSGHVRGYYYAEHLGMNMLMTDVAAAFLRDTIMHFDEASSRRREVAQCVEEIFSDLSISTSPINHTYNGRAQNYQTYALFTKNRNLVLEVLRINGIEARPCWPFLINDQPATSPSVKKQDGDLANARRFADQIINIPIYPAASQGQLDRLRKVITQITESGLIKVGRS